jgi:hypothetical protein
VLVPFMGGRTFLPFVREKPVNTLEKAKEKAAPKAAAASGGGGGGGAVGATA